MMLPKRILTVAPQNLQVGGTQILGQTISNVIDRTYPLEEIIVHVDIAMGGTALTAAGVDNVMAMLANVTLNINDGVQPRAQINYSGVGLLEREPLVGAGMDADTRNTISTNGALGANGNYRINYRVPIVNPQFAEPVRSRALLPCHLWTNDQVLALTFAPAANFYSAGVITNIFVSYTLIQRIITPALSAAIVGSGGFLQSDLIETVYGIPLGQAGQYTFNIPLPGSYCDLTFRHYLGGAGVTRNEVSQNAQNTSFGSETIWQIVSGTTTYHSFRMKALRTLNDFADFYPTLSQTTSPRIGATIIANQAYGAAASVCLDLLTDGTGGADGASELGSVLNCNLSQASGLNMQLVGNVASVATNASQLFIGGHRLYGNLSAYQIVK